MAPTRMLPVTSRLWAVAVLIVFSVVALSAVRHKQITADERRYFEVGQYLTTTWQWDMGATTEHAPLSFYTHGLLLKPFTFASVQEHLFAARAVMLLYAWGLGLAVYEWARALYGAKAGLLALVLWAALPDTLAHAPLITTDVILACFLTWTGFAVWRWSVTGAWRWAIATGVALGLALLSKYSAALWVPGLVLLGLVLAAGRRVRGLPGPGAGRLLAGIALALGLAYVVLCAGYGGRGMFDRFGEHAWASARLRAVVDHPALARLPLLAPLPWWQGVDYQGTVAESGHPGFLLGRTFLHAPWYYLPVAFLYKVPTPFLVLLALMPPATKRAARTEWRALVCLLGPPLALTYYMMFYARVAAGFRYMYPLLPALCIWLGRCAAPDAVMFTQVRNGVRTLVVLCVAVAAWHYPNYLAYVNLFAGGEQNAYKIFADSTLDWGQDPPPMTQADGDTPPIVNPGPVPVAGTLLVNVNTYHDLFSRGAPHAWLHALPVERVFGGVWLELDGSDAVASAPPLLAAMARGDVAAVERTVEERGDIPLDRRVTAYRWLALAYVERGDGAAARHALWMARALELAEAYGLDPAVAYGACLDVAADRPDDPVARNNAGVAAYLEGQLAAAAAHLEAAIARQPRLPAAYSNVAIVDAARGRWAAAAARQATHDAIVFHTSSRPFHPYRVYYGDQRMMLGNVLELWPKYTVGQLEAEAAWARRPTPARGAARVRAYVQAQRLAEAGIALQEAEARFPGAPALAEARREWAAAVAALRRVGKVSV